MEELDLGTPTCPNSQSPIQASLSSKKKTSLGQRTKSEAARWPSLLTFEQDSGTADNQTGFNDDSVQAPNGNKFAALRPFKEGKSLRTGRMTPKQLDLQLKNKWLEGKDSSLD